MYPTIHIFGKNISSHMLLFVIGLAAMIIINILRRKHMSYPVWKAAAYTLMAAGLSIAGAKILYAAENPARGLSTATLISGVSFFGAVFLLPVFIWLIRKAGKQPFGLFMDYLTPSLVAMLAALRIGCWCNGCCGGIALAGLDGGVSVIPTQLIECACDLIILLVLFFLEWSFKEKGLLYPFFLFLYGILRFIIEFFRDTPKDWLGMSHGQWFALASIAIGIILIARILPNVLKEQRAQIRKNHSGKNTKPKKKKKKKK